MKAALPPAETERLAALASYQILDTPPEQSYDEIALLASQICNTPIALISLVDGNRQWFKSRVGLDTREMHRDIAFCAHALLQDDLLEVGDARKDARFADNPLVTGEPKIRFYAGAPLVTPYGQKLGTVCAIDFQPRKLNPEQAEGLRILSRFVVRELEARRQLIELWRTEAALRLANDQMEQGVKDRTEALAIANSQLKIANDRFERAVRGTHDGLWDWNIATKETIYSDRFMELLGYLPGELPSVVDTWSNLLHEEDKPRIWESVKLYFEKAGIYDVEYRLRTKSGEYRWFRARAQAEWDEQGRPTRMAGSITDITEHKRDQLATLDYQEQLRAMASKLVQGEEIERRRIASDLHDQVGQMLAACRIKLGVLGDKLPEPSLRQEAAAVGDLLQQAIEDMRSLTFELSPQILHELGLRPALQWLAEKYSIPNSPRVNCETTPGHPLDYELKVHFFRIARELLQNAVKHAHARNITLRFGVVGEGVARLEVQDDGVGYNLNEIHAGKAGAGGFGLFSIRDRIRSFGGKLEITSSPGAGTRATVCVTLPNTASEKKVQPNE